MARPSDLLRRFRLMAVPGRAGIAGVPADHAALLREELAPVFAALHGSLQRADDALYKAKNSGRNQVVAAEANLVPAAPD